MKHSRIRKNPFLLVTVIALAFAFIFGAVPFALAEEPAATAVPISAVAPLENPDADGKFTIAIIPDSQQEVVVDKAIKGEYFKNRTKWLVDHKDDLDLRIVLHTGDVVNWGNVAPKQFEIASDAMHVLDEAGIPNLLALGNHDTGAVKEGGSAKDPARTTTLVRDTTDFNNYFPVSRNPNIVPFEEGKCDNSYLTFIAGGKKWMAINFELWPRYEAIKWAEDVVASHPDYNVMLFTHSYLNDNGSIFTGSEYGSMPPDYIYKSIVKVYPNVKMVFSGHTGMSTTRVDIGDNGNKIVSILGTFHSSNDNPTQLLEVDAINGTISTRFYAPSDGKEWPEYAKSFDGMNFVMANSVKPELTQLVASSKGFQPDGFTSESFTPFKEALAQAQSVLGDANSTEQQAFEAYGVLNLAKQDLSPIVRFHDVTGFAWYYNAVSFAAAKEITNGIGEGYFSPNSKLRRADSLLLLMRSLGINPDEAITDNFADAGNSYFTSSLATAKRLGVITDIDGNLFYPEAEITRESMFTMLYNLLKKEGKLPKGNSGKTLADFSDSADISPFAQEAMNYFVEKGIVNGYGTTLVPKGTTTRAEMVQLILNLQGK